MDCLERDVTMLTPNRASLVCALTFAVTLTRPAWSQASQVADTDTSCTYAPKAGGDVVQFEHCARIDAAGHPHIERKHLLALEYDRHGLASVNIGGGWYYVRRDGRLAAVMKMDNWAESFADGLARSPVGSKIGFINRNFALVIPARYDGALPFEHGSAEVCIDCKLISDGEHSRYEGGRWGCIDRHGREREPFRPGRSAGHVCRNDGSP
jgi:hypothetical protein